MHIKSFSHLATGSLLALCSSLLYANAPAPLAKFDLAKGKRLATSVCIACHTVDGSRGMSANPILQGQHQAYLYKQLVEFKSGKRDNAIMKGIASGLSDQDMKDVSAYFASLKPVNGAAKAKDLVAMGEKIYRGGIQDRQIAACAGCHSPNGAGIPAQYPRLSGQHAEYTEAQLLAFRQGKRNNSVQMTGVASKMNDKEIKAVSDYIAGLR
jgi:cytochrome c553